MTKRQIRQHKRNLRKEMGYFTFYKSKGKFIDPRKSFCYNLGDCEDLGENIRGESNHFKGSQRILIGCGKISSRVKYTKKDSLELSLLRITSIKILNQSLTLNYSFLYPQTKIK